MTAPWLTLVGIGEDGVAALPPATRALIGAAGLVVGARRHLALAEASIRGDRLAWPSPMEDGLPAVLARRGQPTVVLASGDPFCFGVGSLLARHVPADAMLCLPAPSAASLACARLGWAVQQVRLLSVCGRPVRALLPALQPGARLLVLSADDGSPEAVASLLRERGFGASILHVLEALGGPAERHRVLRADDAMPADIARLNLLAIGLSAGPATRPLPLTPGLPDESFEHDGQLTRREIRAMTLSALAPCQGETLWDVGAGAGSISIEWMLRHPDNRAVALERDAGRAARIARNAHALGVPELAVRQAAAPEGLATLAEAGPPDAVFVGGGVGRAGVLDAAWSALGAGGRLVANVVTIEGEAALFAAHARFGGSLTRLSVDRLDRIGGLHGFRPAMTVTQLVARR